MKEGREDAVGCTGRRGKVTDTNLRRARSLACALALTIVGMSAGIGKEPIVVMEEFAVPAIDPEIQLYVRNKHPQGLTHFPAEKILLYVHGATYPSETTFDLRLNGVSWMEYIAEHGYDVYLVDLRGYGKSTRPPEMDKPAVENEPIVRTETAIKDVSAAVDFILKRRGVAKINLMGWSWVPPSWVGTPRRTTTRSTASYCTRRNGFQLLRRYSTPVTSLVLTARSPLKPRELGGSRVFRTTKRRT